MFAVVVLCASCGGSGSGGNAPTSPNNPALNLGGTYSLRVDASASCSAKLPAWARSRTYDVTFSQPSAANVVMELKDSNGRTVAGFIGFVSPGQQSVTGPLQIGDPPGMSPSYAVSGGLTLPYNNSGLRSGTLNGFVGQGFGNLCTAANHEVILQRR